MTRIKLRRLCPLLRITGYDENGDTRSDAQGRSFTWDFENRLTQVVNPGGVGTTTFRYDPFGRRIQRSGPLGATNYLYDGDNSIEELDQSGNVLGRYTQTLLIDDPLAELRSGTTTYYEADGINSITSLTSATSTIAGTYAYDTFGNLSASTVLSRIHFDIRGVSSIPNRVSTSIAPGTSMPVLADF